LLRTALFSTFSWENFMLNNVLDRIGELNPQLMRELKSRVSWRNVGITVFLSAIGQAMVLISQSSKLPVPDGGKGNGFSYTQYCLKHLPDNYQCQLDAAGNPLIDWPKWWLDNSFGLSAVMIFGLFAGGVYLLASNFSQEERRGTLNFIRLTPQQAGSIIGGKLAGVPILVYLGTALAIPLQFHAVQEAHITKLNVLSWDLLMVSMGILLYLGAILATMWFKAQSILLAGMTLCITYPLIYMSMMWYSKRDSDFISWYSINMGNHIFSYLLFTGMTSAGIYWLYQAIQRRYLKPTATVLSKKQSYAWSGIYHATLAGFAVYRYSYSSNKDVMFHLPFGLGDNGFSSGIISIFAFSWLMLLIPLLLPSQQSLVEWSRQRPVTGSKRPSLLADLIAHEKSPAMLAVAINIAIAALVWLPLSLLNNDSGYLMPRLILGISMTAVLAVIYSTITHWCLFWKVNQRHAWMVGIISCLVFLPVVFGAVVNVGNGSRNPAFLFSPFLWTSIRDVSGFTILGIFLTLLGLMAWLNMKLWRGLKKVGRSESFKNFKPKAA
jgi:ABC-type transport system involved in cytochrome c biogenesis permease component